MPALTTSSIYEKIGTLFQYIGRSISLPSIYDTFFGLLMPEPWPYSQQLDLCISWQNPDGSWGFPHDSIPARVLNTLTGIYIIQELGFSSHIVEKGPKEKAINFIENGIEFLKNDNQKVVPLGDKFLFVWLINEIYSKSPDLDFTYLLNSRIIDRYNQKKKLLGNFNISSKIPAAHMAEGLIDKLDEKTINQLVLPNGSIGCSPSTSAYYFVKKGIFNPYSYLESCLVMNGGLTSIHTSDLFEIVWSTEYLSKEIHFRNYFKNHLKKVATSWNSNHTIPGGISVSSDWGCGDLDCTSVSYYNLKQYNFNLKPINWDLYYQNDDGSFITYQYEIDSSFITQLNHIRILLEYPTIRDDESTEKLFSWFIRKMNNINDWFDKFQTSIFYIIDRITNAFDNNPNLIPWKIELIRDWLEDHQNQDGGWGTSFSTHYETSLAINALIRLERSWNLDIDYLINKARNFFIYNREYDYFSFWMGKSGYFTPILVDYSVILSAMLFIARR